MTTAASGRRTDLTVPDEVLGPDGNITINRWLKQPGEQVAEGDSLAELSIHRVGRVLVNKPEHWQPFVLTSPANGYLISVMPERTYTDIRGTSLGVIAEAPLDTRLGSNYSIYEGTNWYTTYRVAGWADSVTIVRWLRGSGEQLVTGDLFVELEYHGQQVFEASSVAGHLVYTLEPGYVAAANATVATVFHPFSFEIPVPATLTGGASSATVKQWYKHRGERVEAGELFIELDCDGTPMPLVSSLAGYVEDTVPEGQTVTPGMILGFTCYDREAVLSRQERWNGIVLPMTVLPDNQEWEKHDRRQLRAEMLRVLTERYACPPGDAEQIRQCALWFRSHIRNFVARSIADLGSFFGEITERQQAEIVSRLEQFQMRLPAVYGGGPEPERIPGLTRDLCAELVPSLVDQYRQRMKTVSPLKLWYRRTHM